MKSNIDKLIELRNLAILSKSHLQFGLTSLLLRLEYGNEETLAISQQEKEL